MSGLGASADCPGSITAGNGDSICEPLINGSPVSVINSVARSGATNYSLNDTVLGLDPGTPGVGAHGSLNPKFHDIRKVGAGDAKIKSWHDDWGMTV